MGAINIILTLYCGMLFIGAFFGWKAGSKISLIMGVGSGLVALWGLLLLKPNPQVARIVFASLSGALTLVFTLRFFKTKKFMPAGMLLGINVLIFLIVICQFINA